MSISATAAATEIHPLPVPKVCPYECCRPEGAEATVQGRGWSLVVGHQHPGQLPPDLRAAACPTLEQPFLARGMHCPSLEPLERLVAGRRRDGWVPDFDAVEAGVAAAMACGTCGGRLCYLALAPAAGAPATAWGICVTCRHWVQL
jgi:hypothetical protein